MTKQEFYNNIDWQAPLCRDFFMKLYGYGLYDKEFLAASRAVEEVMCAMCMTYS